MPVPVNANKRYQQAEAVSVNAVIDADADDYELGLKKDGNNAVLVSKIDGGIVFGREPYIDLDVSLPAR